MKDDDYWNAFYARPQPAIDEPSTFARWCAERLAPDTRLFELGCGNGRDARFFAARGLRVTACDRAPVAIQELTRRVNGTPYRHGLELVVADMAALPDLATPVDVVYSRFTLHAVTAEEASAALRWAHRNLAPGGRFLAEARSVQGSLYGQGIEVARDTFLHHDHRRRFLRADELRAELAQIGFAVAELIEAAGLARHRDDDPVVIRVEAVRG